MPMSVEEFEGKLITLNPPLLVSGKAISLEIGEEPLAFADGLAVAFNPHYWSDSGILQCIYLVIMSDGKMREVDHEALTSARPWTPEINSTTKEN